MGVCLSLFFFFFSSLTGERDVDEESPVRPHELVDEPEGVEELVDDAAAAAGARADLDQVALGRATDYNKGKRYRAIFLNKT